MKHALIALLVVVGASAVAKAGCGEDDAAQTMWYYAKTKWHNSCHVVARYMVTENDNQYFQVLLKDCVPTKTLGGVFWVVLREVSDSNCSLVEAPRKITPQ